MEIDKIDQYKIEKSLRKTALFEHFLVSTGNGSAILTLFAEAVVNEPLKERLTHIKPLLMTLEHPCIPKVLNVQVGERSYIVAEYAKGLMRLDEFLDLKSDVLSENELETIAKQLASALDYMHKLKLGKETLFHGSISPQNVLVNKNASDLQIYIIEFSFFQIIGKKSYLKILYEELSQLGDVYSDLYRNLCYLAPEQKSIFDVDEVDIKSDAFAVGMLIYQLITKSTPEGCFEFPSNQVLSYKYKWDKLIYCLLQQDSVKRPRWMTDFINEVLYEQVDTWLAWEDIEKKVEDALQMSFQFHDQNDVTPKPVLKPTKIERPVYDPDPGAVFQRERTVSRYTPTEVKIREVEPLLTEMKIIQSGTYVRGSNEGSRDEMPKHEIELSMFAIDVHPVTNEQFIRFLMAMGGEKDANNNDIIQMRHSRIKRSAGKLIIESGYQKHPVVGITWYGAVSYSKWVGKRLPTEAEWEIAAQGGLASPIYPCGDEIDRKKANFFSLDTTPVMSYPPNGYGLYDMAGNVYEWCQDWYLYSFYDTSAQEPQDPKGPQQGVYRVLRGGCWKSLSEDLRCSHRQRNNPRAFNTYGFRCATDVK